MTTTLDDHGTTWHVKPGDPGAKMVNELKKRGFEYIVLPRGSYISGEIPEAGGPGEAEPMLRGETIPHVRLMDCLEVLCAG